MATVKMTCAMLRDAVRDGDGYVRADVARGPVIRRVWCQGWVLEDDGFACAMRDGTGDVRVERRARERALRAETYVVVRGTLASDDAHGRVVREADVVGVDDASVGTARSDAWLAEVAELWDGVFAAGLGCA